MFRYLAALLGVCLFAPTLWATTASVDHPGSLPILLGVDRVRAELKLDSLQRALLDSLRGEYKSAARQLTNPLPQTARERAVAHAKLLRLNEQFNRRAVSILSPVQRVKLSVIEAKFLGPTVLYSPAVQAKLKLTDEQKQRIEAIRQKGIAYVEVTPALSQRLSQGEAVFPFSTDGHPTAAGHDAIAQAVAHSGVCGLIAGVR